MPLPHTGFSPSVTDVAVKMNPSRWSDSSLKKRSRTGKVTNPQASSKGGGLLVVYMFVN